MQLQSLTTTTNICLEFVSISSSSNSSSNRDGLKSLRPRGLLVSPHLFKNLYGSGSMHI